MIPNSPFLPPAIPDELGELSAAIAKAGRTPEEIAAWVEKVSELPGSANPLEELKSRIGDIGAEGRFERLVLAWTAASFHPKLAQAAVPAKVKELWEQERRWMTETATDKTIALSSPGFEAAAKIATLRRFPAGPMDWEISGIPRSWLLQTQAKANALRLSAFVASRLGGFKPLFFLHMGRKPRNRTLILEVEVMKMYHRVARAIQSQPDIRGLMAYGWFHDPAALAANPHLEWLNRPYRDEAGLLLNMGLADAASGVAEGNSARRKSLNDGTMSYRIGLAVWPRDAMLRWAAEHPEWAD